MVALSLPVKLQITKSKIQTNSKFQKIQIPNDLIGELKFGI